MMSSPLLKVSRSDEISLIAGIRVGDQRACARLVNHFRPQMMAAARRFMRNDHDCDDAIQDAFICAFRSIKLFKAKSRLGTWLHRITINSCLMRLRSESSRREKSIEGLREMVEARDRSSKWRSRSHDPLEILQTDEIFSVVQQAIDDLPDEHRKLLRIRYIDKNNTAAAAVLLETTVNNVKSRDRRARRALLGRLDGLITGDNLPTYMARSVR